MIEDDDEEDEEENLSEGAGGGKFTLDVQDFGVNAMALYQSTHQRSKIESTIPTYFKMLSEDMMLQSVHQQQLLVSDKCTYQSTCKDTKL